MANSAYRAIAAVLLCLLMVVPAMASTEESHLLQHKAHLRLRHRSRLHKAGSHLVKSGAAGVPIQVGVGNTTNGEDDTDDDDDDDDSDDDNDDSDNQSNSAAPKAADTARAQALKKAERKVQVAERALQENEAEQKMYSSEVKSLENQAARNLEVDKKMKLVANETNTPKLATFLGDMWKDMRKFAVPFYLEHIRNLTVGLKKQEKVLEKQYDEATEDLKEVKEGGNPKPAKKKTEAEDALRKGLSKGIEILKMKSGARLVSPAMASVVALLLSLLF